MQNYSKLLDIFCSRFYNTNMSDLKSSPWRYRFSGDFLFMEQGIAAAEFQLQRAACGNF